MEASIITSITLGCNYIEATEAPTVWNVPLSLLLALLAISPLVDTQGASMVDCCADADHQESRQQKGTASPFLP